jgi:D-glycero-alpha-D-manno-heptose-7-phosphate kinase
MIISKTPLRISFVGGGSDLESFYKYQPGAVVSTAIDKYMHIAVAKRFDGKIHVAYSKVEIVDKLSELQHNLARETLKFLNIKKGIEIFPICDIPAETGLATSAAYTVGLLNSLYAYKGIHPSASKLASDACIVEIQKAKRKIGKQDQYVVAYGGINFIKFDTNGNVKVEPIMLSKSKIGQMEKNFLLFYTGKSGLSTKVLNIQSAVTAQKKKRLIVSKMVNIAYELKKELGKGNIDSMGYLLHDNWLLKKQITESISNSYIDHLYETAIKSGAIGGKICGAGGRGFLLLYAPFETHPKIIRSLSKLRKVDFALEESGTTIVYNDEL